MIIVLDWNMIVQNVVDKKVLREKTLKVSLGLITFPLA